MLVVQVDLIGHAIKREGDGLEVSDRGRVSAEVRKAYYEVNPNN